MPIPTDSYTPHGYLNNPAHTYRLNPSGVIRSIPAIGMGWHYPALHGGYNPRWLYRAFLRFAFVIDGAVYMTGKDFKDAGVALRSDTHSSNIFDVGFSVPSKNDFISIHIEFHLLDENTLVADVSIDGAGKSVAVAALVDYERNIGWSRLMEYSIFAHPIKTADAHPGLTIGAFPEGTAFSLTCTGTETAPYYAEVADVEDLRDWLQSGGQNVPPVPPQPQEEEAQPTPPRRIAALLFALVTHTDSTSRERGFILGRGETAREAEKNARPRQNDAYVRLVREDEAFWDIAPQLSGDWPEHVRRGMVYDFETLRMMVRQPTGIYKHVWDAMQVQGPRTVLAEAAIDALAFSYADPETAKAVLLGTFADAPEPNVPCSREDGSYNMVAENGQACGTAPEWCFPFHCIEIVYRKTGDVAWLRQIYPYAAAYVDWWLAHRTKDDGGLYYFCSWEAGQDNSPRFGKLPSAGSDASHIRPADLYAAVAQSARLLSEWAKVLATDEPSDPLGGSLWLSVVEKWAAVAARYTADTQALWHDGWFHDYDAAAGAVSAVKDTMQLAPLLCGVATDAQKAALLPLLPDPPKHGLIWHPLMWPSIAFCLIEACSEAGAFDVAAQHCWNIVNPVYRWLDSDPESIAPKDGGLPGVGREYWPQVVNPNAHGGGAEVYGWGAIGPMLLIRHIIGFREEAEGFTLTPNLPAALRVPGKVYRVKPLHFRGARISLKYVVNADDAIAVRLIHIADGKAYRVWFDVANGQTARFRRIADTLIMGA